MKNNKTKPQALVEFQNAGSRESSTINLIQGENYTLGSGKENDLVFTADEIQLRHALIELRGNEIIIEPIENAQITINGQSVHTSQRLNNGDFVILGGVVFKLSVSRMSLQGKVPVEKQQSVPPSSSHNDNTVTIGRSPDCDLSISSPVVTAHHAELNWDGEDWLIRDLSSTNGTFVNGLQVKGRQELRAGDLIDIASFEFVFTGDEIKPVDLTGQIKIEVQDLYKEVQDRSSSKPKRLLDQINLVVESGEFVGIFGTSGSGKSTLLDALNGRRPATGGNVYFNGSDLNRKFEKFRSAIGYVPQQDIVHRKIKINSALGYTARLRLPPDTEKNEIEDHICRVLKQIKLTEKADLSIDTPIPLSGGQLKRVSLAVELVANPNVLFLDEVTSGLDAGTDQDMMMLFRELADNQKTVICVTHTLENIDACHLVILLHKGRLVYFGPPEMASGYFGIDRLTKVYKVLENSPENEWADRFEQSEMYKTYVLDRRSANLNENINSAARVRSKKSFCDFSQTITLMMRYLDIMFSDRRNLLIQILQAPVIGGIIGLVFDTGGELAEKAAAESKLSFMLVLTSIWFGCFNAAREIVKELPIYLRERSVNLSIAPYLMSKIIPLSALCFIQCALFLFVVASFVEFSGNFYQQLFILFLSAMTATTMGLAVSALVDTNDKAISIVPLLLIPQVVLSGAIVQLNSTSEWIARVTTIAYWAFDAMKGSLSSEMREVKNFMNNQPIIEIRFEIYDDVYAIIGLGLAFLILAFFCLKLKDRKS